MIHLRFEKVGVSYEWQDNTIWEGGLSKSSSSSPIGPFAIGSTLPTCTDKVAEILAAKDEIRTRIRSISLRGVRNNVKQRFQ